MASNDPLGLFVEWRTGTPLPLFNTFVNLMDFNAVGDGVTDDTDAINRAFETAYTKRRSLYIPGGNYKVREASAGAGYCILNKGVSVRGEGTTFSQISPLASVANTVSFMRIAPLNNADISHLVLEDFLIYANISGSAQGKYGIHILTNTNIANLGALYMRNVYVAPTTDVSVKGENSGAVNAQGVPSLCIIENCYFFEGMDLVDAGDSISIRSNTLKATGTRKGVSAVMVNGAGGLAGLLNIEGNNIVAEGGACQILNGHDVKVAKNNIEQIAGAGSNAAVIDIDGATGTITSAHVIDNYIGISGTTTVTRAIRINAVNSGVVDVNHIDAGIAITTGIDLTANANSTFVGVNRYDGAMGSFVLNNGVNTRHESISTTRSGDPWTVYTPAVTTGAGTITTSTTDGAWTQINNIVFFRAQITVTNNGTGATDLRLSLPVAPIASKEMAVAARNVTSGQACSGRIRSEVGTLVLISRYDGTYPIAAGETVSVSGCYEAA